MTGAGFTFGAGVFCFTIGRLEGDFGTGRGFWISFPGFFRETFCGCAGCSGFLFIDAKRFVSSLTGLAFKSFMGELGAGRVAFAVAIMLPIKHKMFSHRS